MRRGEARDVAVDVVIHDRLQPAIYPPTAAACTRVLPTEATMTSSKFLTPEEVAERYWGGISVGTLRNWRAMRLGPSYVKIGKAVLYPIDDLDAWDEQNRVRCHTAAGVKKSDNAGA